MKYQELMESLLCEDDEITGLQVVKTTYVRPRNYDTMKNITLYGFYIDKMKKAFNIKNSHDYETKYNAIIAYQFYGTFESSIGEFDVEVKVFDSSKQMSISPIGWDYYTNKKLMEALTKYFKKFGFTSK